jgi:peptide methionine sulfoxide reductase MsrA
MPTPTFTPLANITLGSSALTVTFSSIPATYRDLVLVYNTTSSTAAYATMRLNGDTGTNYPFVIMYANDNAQSTSTVVEDRFYESWLTMLPSSRAMAITNIMDYSATDKHKNVLTRFSLTSNTGSFQTTTASTGRWTNTSAITSITLGSSWNSGSTFALYGIVS